MDGYDFRQIQLQEIPALGHSWTDFWTWTDTAQATVTLTCGRCGESMTMPAEIACERQQSETDPGDELAYTATAEIDGQTYTDRKIVSLTEPVSVKAGDQTTLTAPEGKDGYRWQYSKDGGNTWVNCASAGHDQATFSFRATAGINGRLYRCVLTDNGTETIPEATEISVLAITKQPAAQSVKEGEKATFTVTAVGEGVTYQWQVNKTGTWANCTSAGNKTATFSFTTKASYSGWQYRCVVANEAGSITSSVAALTVTPAATKPVIKVQPDDQNVIEGSRATFKVTAEGEGLTYQWQVYKTDSWKDCTSAGNDTATFSFTAKTSYSGWQYRCIVTDSTGSTTSATAKLTVTTAGPTITKQPADQTVAAGNKASFTVSATGDGLTYQWQVNKTGTWNNCTSAGNDSATFSFTAKTTYSGWQYRCVVTDSTGKTTTQAALLTVN